MAIALGEVAPELLLRDQVAVADLKDQRRIEQPVPQAVAAVAVNARLYLFVHAQPLLFPSPSATQTRTYLREREIRHGRLVQIVEQLGENALGPQRQPLEIALGEQRLHHLPHQILGGFVVEEYRRSRRCRKAGLASHQRPKQPHQPTRQPVVRL